MTVKMTVIKKNKKPGMTPEAKSKRFEKLQAKRKRQKENRKLGKKPKDGDEAVVETEPQDPVGKVDDKASSTETTKTTKKHSVIPIHKVLSRPMILSKGYSRLGRMS